jgi:hypothetical protein
MGLMCPVPGKQNAPILAMFHFHSRDEMRPASDTRRKHVWIAEARHAVVQLERQQIVAQQI